MASSNQHPNNQPRRKRNKKPVKRYSEEYNNRPNPYTGYSSDGNYHPGAKKRSIDEPPAPASSHKATYDVSPAAMTDAVWGPVGTPPQPRQPAAKPVPSTAHRFTESQSQSQSKSLPNAAASENRPPRQTPPDSNMAHLSETAKQLEGADAQRPPVRTGSHRRRNTNKKAQEEARRAKTEAKKAAMDKIAQGVAAHSASERMMEDIARASESAAAHTSAPAAPAQPVKATTGVNWDEFYDAAFPPKEAEPSAPSAPSGHPSETDKSKEKTRDERKPEQKSGQSGKQPNKQQGKRPRDFDQVSEHNDPMGVSPVLLGDDEALPYDLIAEENRQEAEEAAKAAEASAQAQEQNTGDACRIPPLDPADLIPVLDFDKPSPEPEPQAETVSETEPPEESAGEDDTVPDIGDEISLDEFLSIGNAVASEAEKTEENAAPEPETPSGYDFGADSGEGWHELTPPAVDEPSAEQSEPSAPTVPQDDSVSLLSQRLLESYMQIEDTPLNYIPEDTADEPDNSEEFHAETVDINQFFTQPEPSEPSEPSAPVEVEITTDDTPREPAVIAEPEKAEAPAEEKPVQKPKKKPRPAEPFSVVATEPEKDTAVYVAAEEEVVKPYQPQKKPKKKQPKDENVFESVLIVDDSRSVVDDAAARKQDDMQFLHSVQQENPTAVFKMLDGPIITPSDYDDADFQEGWLDDEEGDEMANRNKRTRRRISAFIGGVAILFAIMILGYVVGTVITGFTNIGSTSEKKAEYSAFIAPVVLGDPAPFESVETADNQMLLESSIWRVLRQMGEDETTEFNYDATGKIVISADRVNKAGRELFGDDVVLNMNVLSESDGSAIYYYDSIDNSFHVSTFEIIGPAPVITKIAQKSDHVVLVVGYAMQDEVMSVSSDNTSDCYKYMEYVLVFNGSRYHIQSVRNYVDS